MSVELMLKSLDGLSIGDGFGAARGEMMFADSSTELELPPPVWRWTDDTHMALSIVENLSEYGEVRQDALAKRFGARFLAEPHRGYAFGAISLLMELVKGADWRQAAVGTFPDGSYGNGGAMRVAPLGAYFAGDPTKTAQQAAFSATITHAHPEGKAGAIATAVATSIAATSPNLSPHEFIDEVILHTPESLTRRKMLLSKAIKIDDVEDAAINLGVGWDVSAQDTVPFCVWVAAHIPSDFEAAMWLTSSMGGDVDTTCAIVGGIIAPACGELPAEWLARREPLPDLQLG